MNRSLLKQNAPLFESLLRLADPLVIVIVGVVVHSLYLPDLELPDRYWFAFIGMAGLTVIVFPMMGLYGSRRGVTAFEEVRQIVRAVGLLAVAWFAFLFLSKTGADFSRVGSVYWFALTLVAYLLLRGGVRLFLRQLRRRGYNLRHVVIVGAGRLGTNVAQRLRAAPWAGFAIRGYYDDDANLHGQTLAGAPVLGAIDRMFVDLDAQGVDQVWIALPLRSEERIREVMTGLLQHSLQVRFVPDIYNFNLLHHSVSEIEGLPVINLTDSPLHGPGLIAKNVEDFVLALLLVTLGAPALLAIAIGVKLSSPGPVLYRQERVTWNGNRFSMLKFRSMPLDSEREAGPVWSRPGEKRATPFGRFLRRFSLDELPQLFNVLERRDVDRRAASGAPGVRATLQARYSGLHAEAPGQGRHHRLGAGQRPSRRHEPRTADPVRPLLHRELVDLVRPAHHRPHAAPHRAQQERVLNRDAAARARIPAMFPPADDAEPAVTPSGPPPATGDAPVTNAVVSHGGDTSTPAARGRGIVVRLAALFVAALAACVVGYLAFAVPGKWFTSAHSLAWGPKDLQVTKGSSRMVGDELAVAPADASGLVVVSVKTALKSTDYAAVEWIAIDVPDHIDVSLVWSTDYKPQQLNSIPLTIVTGRLLPVVMQKHPAWIGNIQGLALAMKGPVSRAGPHPRRRGETPFRSRSRARPHPRVVRVRRLDRHVDQHGHRRRRSAGSAVAAAARGSRRARGADRRGDPAHSANRVADRHVRRARGVRAGRVVAAGSALDVEPRAAGRFDCGSLRRQELGRQAPGGRGRTAVRLCPEGEGSDARDAGTRLRGGGLPLLPRTGGLSPVSAQRVLRSACELDAAASALCGRATGSSFSTARASSTTPRRTSCAGTTRSRYPPSSSWPAAALRSFRPCAEMLDFLALALGLSLPWVFGAALLAVAYARAAGTAFPPAAWVVGCGWFVGIFSTTLLMRGCRRRRRGVERCERRRTAAHRDRDPRSGWRVDPRPPPADDAARSVARALAGSGLRRRGSAPLWRAAGRVARAALRAAARRSVVAAALSVGRVDPVGHEGARLVRARASSCRS